jgi:predicted dehydrogenase
MHIPKLQEIDGVDIVAVANRTVASGQKVADEFGIPKVCSNWREIVDDPDVDAVVIGTWPYVHSLYTCAALRAGKHVMCEARMAMNACEARRMLKTWRSRPGLVAQIVPSPMTLGVDLMIKELIADGYVGDIVAIDMKGNMGGLANFESTQSWRQDMDLSGLNILGMGIWYEALARWVGHAQVVHAMAQTVVTHRQNAAGERVAMQIPDHVDVTAKMLCGAQARLQFSAVTGFDPEPAACTIYGTDGTLKLVGGKQLLGARRGDDALAPIDIPAEKQSGWRVEAEFIGAIRGEEEIRLTNFVEGVKYMEFTEAVSRSAATGRNVALPLRLDG